VQKENGSAMGKKLLIVESPAKAKTIGKYLGPEFTVKSSVGFKYAVPEVSAKLIKAGGRGHKELVVYVVCINAENTELCENGAKFALSGTAGPGQTNDLQAKHPQIQDISLQFIIITYNYIFFKPKVNIF
jgi:hypothetical protein